MSDDERRSLEIDDVSTEIYPTPILVWPLNQ